MTIIVSVKINDGIIMAADSALTFANGQIYHHANKIVNLRKGLPIGVMSTGDGGIGNASMETLFKDLRKRFTGGDPEFQDWELDPNNYTLQAVADLLRTFLFEEKVQGGGIPTNSVIRICGYSAKRPLAETWEVQLAGDQCAEPSLIQGEDVFGLRWNGEMEAMDRLLFGLGSGFINAAVELGHEEALARQAHSQLLPKLMVQLSLNAMPIQDAIDLARFMVETTIGFLKFSLGRAKTVGGTVEIAAITKHEGFKWVQRKHFFSAALNPNV
jgi:hypothetical protein